MQNYPRANVDSKYLAIAESSCRRNSQTFFLYRTFFPDADPVRKKNLLITPTAGCEVEERQKSITSQRKKNECHTAEYVGMLRVSEQS